MGQLEAHLSWQAELGATGIPRDPELKQKLRENPLPDFTQTAPGKVPSPAPAPPPTSPRPAASSSDFQPPNFGEEKKNKPTHIVKRPIARGPARDETPLIQLGKSLDEVQEKVRGCTLCELHEKRTQTVFSRGSGTSGLWFVGEGPGADEDAQGEPFVGAAGKLLDKMIAGIGFSRDEVYVCNVVKCRPPNNRRPTLVEMQTCSPYLRRQIQLLEPRVIVALGGTAVSGLLGVTEGITRLRGRFRLYEGRIAVMPTFHPAYLLRNPAAKREVWNDLRQVLEHMGRKLPPKN